MGWAQRTRAGHIERQARRQRKERAEADSRLMIAPRPEVLLAVPPTMLSSTALRPEAGPREIVVIDEPHRPAFVGRRLPPMAAALALLGVLPPRLLVLALALLPLAAAAQTPTHEPVRFELLSTIGTVVYAEGQSKTPVAGLRLTVDAPLFGGLHAIARVDLNRQSDGGAIDAGSTVVPTFDSGEIYVGAYWRRGAVGIEVFGGQAYALSDRALLLTSDPWIGGAGVRLVLKDGFVFIGGGVHGATGKGARGLVSFLIPLKSNTSMYLDGAAASERKSVVRSGIAVRF